MQSCLPIFFEEKLVDILAGSSDNIFLFQDKRKVASFFFDQNPLTHNLLSYPLKSEVWDVCRVSNFIVKLNQKEPISLIVTGHSLGAAMATVVMVHWLTSGTFVGIELQCYAYASPCVFSHSLSTHIALKHAIKSIVMRDDLVPRLCLGSAFDVRGRLLKMQELRENSSTEYKNLVDMIKSDDKMSKANAASVYKLLDPEEKPKMRLYPAGTIYYGNPLEDITETQLQHFPHELLSDILLSSTMLSDHMPQMYAKLMN